MTDFDHPELWAVKPGGSGERSEDAIIWRLRKGVPSTLSFLLVGGTVLFVNDHGIAMCRNGIPDDVGIENAVTALKQVAGFAEKNKVNVCIEYLNSKVDHKGYVAHEFVPTGDPLTSLAQAVEICDV